MNTKFRGTATKNNNKKERREHTAKIEEIPIIFLSQLGLLSANIMTHAKRRQNQAKTCSLP